MPSLMVLPVHSQTNSPLISCSLHIEGTGVQLLAFSPGWGLGFFLDILQLRVNEADNLPTMPGLSENIDRA